MGIVSRQRASEDTWYGNSAFISTRDGGTNPCIVVSKVDGVQYTLPNCVALVSGLCHADGSSDFLKNESKFVHDAGTWYGTAQNLGMQTSKENPQHGDIVCWSKPGDAGHVAYFDKYLPNGNIQLIESGYHANGTPYINYTEITPDFVYGSKYNFQGFIHLGGSGSSVPLSVLSSTASRPVTVNNSEYIEWIDESTGEIKRVRKDPDVVEEIRSAEDTETSSEIQSQILPLYEYEFDQPMAVFRELGSINSEGQLDSHSDNSIKLSLLNYTYPLNLLYTMMFMSQSPNVGTVSYADQIVWKDADALKKEAESYFMEQRISPYTASALYSIIDMSKVEEDYRDNFSLFLRDFYTYIVVEAGMFESISQSNSSIYSANSICRSVYSKLVELDYPYVKREFEIEAPVEFVNLDDFVIVTQSSVVGQSANDHYVQTSESTSENRVYIPSSVRQNGITSSFTNMDDVENRLGWKKGTTQRAIYEAWVNAGRPTNNLVDTLDGYYLIACTTKFGYPGDIVQFTLDDGTTAKCIIMDSKSENPSLRGEPGNEWGHYMGTSAAVDVIEFESIARQGENARLNQGLTNLGWRSKNVAYIDNLGPSSYKL